MTFDRSLELINKYTKCSECGNEMVGNGEGKLIIEDDLFIRECKCGWSIKIDDTKKTR
ncbi:DUF3797 domain-containing protein [Clostridium botulinum]|uniref:DUF3797 domain-containing protein n=1 Tax=Clostridium botulinum TaxID=1491 RepID=UPI0009B3F40A|nr:DUF3797 domain-containing protein [Clostridium botulinum]MBN1079291.1 DUF3797 domain-containing protein [Clostridium botulinum]MCS6110402.1 DUF3797 domain-containing protein [Clostridium botulinum]NFE13143.1 DUF3797 domain-containing protein [Clostridium botulinum]NFE83127.1 DUF3797 domain-containing protein [Clostridium botulinum]NFG39427.1 DUF3797 domain-containing protein [Clostridium botulinum]